MIRRALLLLALGSLLGIVFATFLGPGPVLGEEAPAQLKADPPAPSHRARDLSRPMIEATRQVRPAVVQISSFAPTIFGRMKEKQSGSGFLISEEGHILTNRHVIEGATRYLVLLQDGRSFERVKVLGADPRSDVAVIKLLDEPQTPLPVAPLGDSDALEVGELVLAIGAPHGLESSVSLGVVSATGRADVLGRNTSEDFIQTDAALNPGNSGGPLVNLDGRVVGINTAIRGGTGANVGIGFSIPINLARTVAVALIEGGVVRRGFLGVRGNLEPGPVLARRGVRAPGGLVVQTVHAGSPAAQAGVRVDDVITEVDGRQLKKLNILYGRLAQAGPGGTVVLGVQRKGRRLEISVELGEEPINTSGIQVANLDKRRAAELDLPANTPGVVVTGIERDSIAAGSGATSRLLPGDVIWRIDWPTGRRYVRNRQDFETVMTELGRVQPDWIHFIIRTREGNFRVRLRPRTG
jgi:S1-C subfamily serine protease